MTNGRVDRPALATRYGRLLVPHDESDMIGRFLVRYGEWAWLETVFVASVIPDGTRLLDAGAFVGTFGLGVAQLRPLGLLCCVEANKTAASLLRANVTACSSCPSAIVEAMVAGPSAVAGTGRAEPGNLGGMSFHISDDYGADGAVPATTLADLRARFGAFGLIKLDIEGMELEALLGDAGFLSQGHTTLWIEANEDVRTLETAQLLLSWNIDVYYFAFPSFNQHNFNGDGQAIFPFAFEAGLLAAPDVTPSLSPELADAGCILRRVRHVGELKDALWRTPRWGMEEWQGAASAEELVALAARSLTGENYAEFLSAAAGQEPRTTIWQRLETVQAALRQSEILAEERRAQVEAEQRAQAEVARRAQVEAELAQQQVLAQLEQALAQFEEVLAQLEAERLERQRIEDMLRATTVLAAERLDQLQSASRDLATMQASTIWRLTVPLRAFFGRHPGLRRLLRKTRTLVRKGVRRSGPEVSRQPRGDDAVDPSHRQAVQGFFDAAFYCAANADVLAADADPLDHFLLHGWREGRAPGPNFDVAYYLSANPDVAAAGINPVLHYVWAGRAEGRLPRRRVNAWQDWLLAAKPPRIRVAEWADAADHSAPLQRSALAALLRAEADFARVVVAVSHDDYATNFGGIQNVIGDEQIAFAAAGWHYLHLSPAAPLPLLAERQAATNYRLRLRLDGKHLGVVSFADLAAALQAARSAGSRLAFVFHHLLGHVPELLATLPAPGDTQTMVWLHDFFTVCPSFNLLRNDIKFCAAPPAASAACTVCVYGLDRLDHGPRMRDFFAALHPLVIAPSPVALRFWQTHGGLPHGGSLVVPPARLTMLADASPVTRTKGAPLRVAHLGGVSLHKGWPVFAQLVEAHAGDSRYEFHHLGLGNAGLPGCTYVPVRVGPDQRDAMIEAIVQRRIDVVVCWSLWPETFCFTVHEALAGGAFVVARQDGGAIWAAVEMNAPAQGCAVADEPALLRLFETGEIERLVAGANRVRGALQPGGNTAELLAGEVLAGKPFDSVGAVYS